MSKSEAINELAAALAKAQAEFTPIAKTKKVNFGATKYNYADLAEMIKATTPALSKYGLCITQELQPSADQGLALYTTLMHSSGQYRTSIYPVPRCVKPQDQGSQITYARKYTLQAVLNIAADEDDDGQIAAAAENEEEQTKKEDRTKTSTSGHELAATEKQIARVWAVGKAKGYNQAEISAALKAHADSKNNITWGATDKIVKNFEANPKNSTTQQKLEVVKNSPPPFGDDDLPF